MRTIDIFAENTNELYTALETIANRFPCFVETTPIEMNWMEIKIECREEDAASIENILADFA